jgi:hypothetical protein
VKRREARRGEWKRRNISEGKRRDRKGKRGENVSEVKRRDEKKMKRKYKRREEKEPYLTVYGTKCSVYL